MTVTTKKIQEGVYAVFYDGAPTSLQIKKGDAPKFGMRQMWDVLEIREDYNRFLFEDRGLKQCVETLERVITAKI